MGLFGSGKKKDKETKNGCSGSCDAADRTGTEKALKDALEVKVLGGGCAKCGELEREARAALAELGMEQTVLHVTDFAQIASYGVMSTPALVVEGKVVCAGRVLKKDEVIKLLREAGR